MCRTTWSGSAPGKSRPTLWSCALRRGAASVCDPAICARPCPGRLRGAPRRSANRGKGRDSPAPGGRHVVTAASNSITAAPLAVISTAAHGGDWWTEEAARADTDWSGLVADAREMMVAAGIIEQPEPKTMTTWDGPSWGAPAKDYYDQRASRRTGETISPERLARLRRLMADDSPTDRAWHELEADRTAPKATVDALMFS